MLIFIDKDEEDEGECAVNMQDSDLQQTHNLSKQAKMVALLETIMTLIGDMFSNNKET